MDIENWVMLLFIIGKERREDKKMSDVCYNIFREKNSPYYWNSCVCM